MEEAVRRSWKAVEQLGPAQRAFGGLPTVGSRCLNTHPFRVNPPKFLLRGLLHSLSTRGTGTVNRKSELRSMLQISSGLQHFRPCPTWKMVFKMMYGSASYLLRYDNVFGGDGLGHLFRACDSKWAPKSLPYI